MLKIIFFCFLILYRLCNPVNVKLRKIEVLDERDVHVGSIKASYHKVGHDNYTFPLKTPKEIVTAAEKGFKSAHLIKKDYDVFVRQTAICNQLFLSFDHMDDRFPVDGQNPCDLERGHVYNWLLTEDFQLTFGKYVNEIEFGVKHIALSGGRNVLCGGEFKIHESGYDKKTKVEWNINSGSFVWYLVWHYGPEYKDFLIKAASKIMDAAESICPDKYWVHNETDFFTNIQPDYDYFKQLCSSVERPDERFLFIDGICPVCQHLDCIGVKPPLLTVCPMSSKNTDKHKQYY